VLGAALPNAPDDVLAQINGVINLNLGNNPTTYELPAQFKDEAAHLYPEATSFAVMMSEHGDEIATNAPLRELAGIMHHVAEALEETLTAASDEELQENGVLNENFANNN
jgi:hypothetical protein